MNTTHCLIMLLTISCSGMEHGPQPFIDLNPAISRVVAHLRARTAPPAEEFSKGLDKATIIKYVSAIPPGLHPWAKQELGQNNVIDTVAWNHDGTLLAASSGRYLAFFDAHMRKNHTSPRHSRGGPHCLAWKPGENRYVSTDHIDLGAQIWSMAFSPSGQEIAAGDSRGDLHIVNLLSDRRPTLLLRGHTPRDAQAGALVHSLAWHPQGNLLASGSFDETVRLWDRAKSWATTHILGHPDPVRSVHWNRDGTRLAVGCGDGNVHLWNNIGQKTGTLSGHEHAFTSHTSSDVEAVAWHPKRNILASGGRDSTIRIWHPDSKVKEAQVLRGHTMFMSSLAWHPNGYVLASGATDSTVRLWIDYRNLLLDYFEGKTKQKPTPQQLWLYSLLFRYKQEDEPIYIAEFLAEVQEVIPGQTMQDLESVRNSLPILVQRALARILDIRKG